METAQQKVIIKGSIKMWLGSKPPQPDEEELEEMVDMVEFCVRALVKNDKLRVVT